MPTGQPGDPQGFRECLAVWQQCAEVVSVKVSNMILVPLTPVLFEEVIAWHERRGLTPPPCPPSDAVTIVDDLGELLAFVGLYEDTSGTFLFAEWAIAREGLPARTSYTLAKFVCEAILARAAVTGRIAIATPRSIGVARVLARFGFTNSGCPMFVAHAPIVRLTDGKPAPCPTKKKRKRRTRSGSRAASRVSTSSSPPEGEGEGAGTPTPG